MHTYKFVLNAKISSPSIWFDWVLGHTNDILAHKQLVDEGQKERLKLLMVDQQE